jgi:acetyltransferase-like isoleucine patch superfamily enzyme
MKFVIDLMLNKLFSFLGSSRFENILKTKILLFYGAKVGNNIFLEQNVRIKGADTGAFSNLKIGDNVVISEGVKLIVRGGLEIGDNVMIGYNTVILTGNHRIPPKPNPIRFSGHKFKKVVLKKDSWVASNVTILPGVVIGEGAVVGAGSVVTKDVPAFTVVAGSPARHLFERE